MTRNGESKKRKKVTFALRDWHIGCTKQTACHHKGNGELKA